jgi:hypothetical protein
MELDSGVIPEPNDLETALASTTKIFVFRYVGALLLSLLVLFFIWRIPRRI